MTQQWQHQAIHILSTKMNGIDELDIKIQKDNLSLDLTVQQYAERCLQELRHRLSSYVEIESDGYRLSNGLHGVRSLCQWQPVANEILMQLHGFVLHKREGFRIFTSLSEQHWRLYGGYITRYMQSIDPYAVY